MEHWQIQSKPGTKHPCLKEIQVSFDQKEDPSSLRDNEKFVKEKSTVLCCF